MKATAFAPGHISGFFQPIYHDDIYKTGSRGAGINLDSGVHATIEISESKSSGINIFFNKKQLEFIVIKKVIEHILPSKPYQINVTLTCDLPIGQGLGISGASALSTSIALCSLLDQPVEHAWMAAHRAEIEMKTGLGDVPAQIHGGVEIREIPGIPPWGKITSIPGVWDIVLCTMDSAISTSDILNDVSNKKRLHTLGKHCTDLLVKKPSLQQFMVLSQEFTKKSYLASDLVLEAIDAVKDCGQASMSMLGESVFAVGKKDELISILSSFGEIHKCSVDLKGARILR